MKVYIGCSGYSYEDWYNSFYPNWVHKDEMLDYYATWFPIVEINVTFYQMPTKFMVERWARTNINYVIKYNREITHEKKLKKIESVLSDFHSRFVPLFREEKIIAFLVQLPPSLHCDYELLEDFLRLVPNPDIHAIEFRHHSWFTNDTVNILKKYKAAFVIVDSPTLPRNTFISTRWSYVRMHGRALRPDWYHYCYSRDELEEWSQKIVSLQNDLDYLLLLFNNHPNGNAPRNAREIANILSLRGVDVVGRKTTL